MAWRGNLRQTSTELKNKAETKSEKATIEIVALMFQAILQEDRIPPGIRVWFARLQMPVLRVALAEPIFLHRRGASGAIAATSDEEVGLIGPTNRGDPGFSIDRDLLFNLGDSCNE